MNDNNNLRVVIDSNVYISALVFGGQPRATVEWLIKNGSIIICTEIITELKRIVNAKFPDFAIELKQLEKLLHRDSVKVEIGEVKVSASRDQDDNSIIEAAIIGRCNFIVSGDKDLLVLKSYESIKILSPSEFLKIIG